MRYDHPKQNTDAEMEMIMILKTYIEVPIEVEFDYSPEEKETRDCPGSPAEVEITGVKIVVNGSELTLTPEQAKQIEAEIWDYSASLREDFEPNN